MSAKTENDDSDENNELEDHTYYDINGFLTKELAPYLEGAPEKTPVLLWVNGPGGAEPFERTGLVPAQAVERAQQDINSEFTWSLCHSIALSYKREILGRLGGNLKCKLCGKPATDLLMSPLSYELVSDPPKIMDIFPTAVCDDADCIIAGRNKYFDVNQKMHDVVKGFCAERGYPEPNPVNLPNICSYCGNNEGKKKKCTRCHLTYYCDRECQRRHWKAGHHEKCKPPPVKDAGSKG